MSLNRCLAAIFQILAILTVVKGSVHIMKLIVLAVFGLGGLVLYQAVASGSPLSHLSTSVGKRSLSEWSTVARLGSSPSLSSALRLDEKECARLYICEVAAAADDNAGKSSILPAHLRARSLDDQMALVEFKAAATFGAEQKSSLKCRQKYKKCPYKSIKQMESIINSYQNL